MILLYRGILLILWHVDLMSLSVHMCVNKVDLNPRLVLTLSLERGSGHC